jgi:succinate dehydrogenase/fumarate reductase flavoprotein subunit
MADLKIKYDVLVVGGGNAALCAAISARRAGASVLVLEVASKFYRGGNTRHTRNMRCAHDAATKELTGPYSEEEFFDDLLPGCVDLFHRVAHDRRIEACDGLPIHFHHVLVAFQTTHQRDL